MSLLTAGGLGYMTSKVPFQPKAFCDSMKKSIELNMTFIQTFP